MGRLGLVVALLVVASAAGSDAATPTVDQLVGRRLVVAMQGTSPTAELLGRVRRGEIAGVVLFGQNVRGKAQLTELTRTLQAAAREGGRPPLLIAADQEGGIVRRLTWAPPAASAQELGRMSIPRVRDIGRQTGLALRAVGVTVDLAPVADVPSVPDAFIGVQRRAFGTAPPVAATRVRAFTVGLGAGGAAATLKHFPGLGLARTSTDVARVTIAAPPTQLEAGLEPFAQGIAGGAALVMLSSAAYPSWGIAGSAAWSPEALRRLRGLGFAGVTITDALEPLARTHRRSVADTALLSARAGVDLLLVVGSESSSAEVYRALVAAARAGRISRASLEASAARVDMLTSTLGP